MQGKTMCNQTCSLANRQMYTHSTHMNTSKLTVLTTDKVCLAARADHNVSLLFVQRLPYRLCASDMCKLAAPVGASKTACCDNCPEKTTASIKDPLTHTRIGAKRRQVPPQRSDNSHAQRAIR